MVRVYKNKSSSFYLVPRPKLVKEFTKTTFSDETNERVVLKEKILDTMNLFKMNKRLECTKINDINWYLVKSPIIFKTCDL